MPARQSAGRRHHADLHRNLVAAGTPAERLPQPRLQSGRERQEGVRRHDAVDCGRRRHQHELPVLAAGPHRAQPPGPPVRRRRVPVRQRVDDGSVHRQDRQPLRQVHGHQHVSACGGDLLGQRVLGEGRLAAAHRSGGEEGSAGLAVRAQLLHLQPPARDRATQRRRAAASSSRIRSTRRRYSARCSSRWTNGRPRARRRRRARCRGCRTARWCRRCRKRRRASRTFLA